ncbi:glycosyltransferase family 2 protein [Pseudorhodoplanes sp.]|uniref:glycosyltransferase family 2 protein n=1 Tax=Pseudorhodoplanes sp. TaxID=1934341 RepID=UPI003D0F611D
MCAAAAEAIFFERKDSRSSELLISFIVPVYNAAATLVRTLESICAAGTEFLEIIIVHDGGTDNSLQIAENWAKARECPARILLLDQPNRGAAAARMTGVKYAQGTYIAFLDSDDHINAFVYRQMAKNAASDGWDIGICRSAVWDATDATTYSFYDWHVWEKLCGPDALSVKSLATAPLLLRLEPNANTRIIKRHFFQSAKIGFPDGLLFEDLPPHFLGLIKATRVGLFNATGYYYTVSRRGKITESRTMRRFDMLQAGLIATNILIENRVSSSAGAAGTAALARLVFWCGQMAPNSTREQYFKESFSLFKRLPTEWKQSALRTICVDTRERLVLLALSSSDLLLALKLCDYTLTRPTNKSLFSPYRDVALKLAVRPMLQGVGRTSIGILSVPLRVLSVPLRVMESKYLAEFLCTLANELRPMAKRFPAIANLVEGLHQAGGSMWNRTTRTSRKGF